MIFHEEQILDTSQIFGWSDLMTTVHSRLNIDEWIFRALKKGPDNNCLEILSHFDEAWKRRKEPGGSKQFYEAWMLHEFRREAYHYLSNLPKRRDLLEWLSLGRHYGMPVRLVDFTYSFYIAVYFAISRRINKENGWILAFNLKWHKEELEAKIVPALAAKCKVSDCKAAFQEPSLFRGFAVDHPQDYVAAVNPFRRNPRLAAQQGLFLCPSNVEHTFEENLKKALPENPKCRKNKLILIPVPHEIRSEAMRELRQMNISSASLFRDLSGWAESQGDLVHRDIQDGRFKKELELELKEPR